MTDTDPRIRELAFRELAALAPLELERFRNEIEAGLTDPEIAVKRAAIAILKKM
jgi:hypothetical protein